MGAIAGCRLRFSTAGLLPVRCRLDDVQAALSAVDRQARGDGAGFRLAGASYTRSRAAGSVAARVERSSIVTV